MVLLCRCLSLKFRLVCWDWRLNSQARISYFHSNEIPPKKEKSGSEKSTLKIHVVNKGLSLCNLGLCLLYIWDGWAAEWTGCNTSHFWFHIHDFQGDKREENKQNNKQGEYSWWRLGPYTNCHIQKVKSRLAQTEDERGHPPQQTLTHLTPTCTHTKSKQEHLPAFRYPLAL